MAHYSVLYREILSFLPEKTEGNYLDVTTGGAGHLTLILQNKPNWKAVGWDTDPAAIKRIQLRLTENNLIKQVSLEQKNFRSPPKDPAAKFDFILADLGFSSFQIDDPVRGFSMSSNAPVDLRLNPNIGDSFSEWMRGKTERELTDLIEMYGEEPKAKVAAQALKNFPDPEFKSAKELAQYLSEKLRYKQPSRIHPATRVFQALRIAINDEWVALDEFLAWAPKFLKPGGRLAIISFHSLEDGRVKNAFRDLAKDSSFCILTERPVVPSELELQENSRSRSAKLRVIEHR